MRTKHWVEERRTGTDYRDRTTKLSHIYSHGNAMYFIHILERKYIPHYKIELSMWVYFRNAQGQIVHLYSGWQCSAGIAVLSQREMASMKNRQCTSQHKKASWKCIQLASTQTYRRRLFTASFLLLLLLLNMTTTERSKVVLLKRDLCLQIPQGPQAFQERDGCACIFMQIQIIVIRVR